MNAAGRVVLRWYGRELGGNRHVMWWVVGREALQFEGYVDGVVGGK